jgi:hypothetical protein
MVRHVTEQPLVLPANGSTKRTVAAQLDKDGVLHLDRGFLSGLRETDALGVPGPLPRCECCWTEVAAAAALDRDEVAMFVGAACVAQARWATTRLVPIVPSQATRTIPLEHPGRAAGE